MMIVNKFERTFLRFATVDSISDRLIIHLKKGLLKMFQFQEETEASLYGDLKRIITYVKFVPCIMHCLLLFE